MFFSVHRWGPISDDQSSQVHDEHTHMALQNRFENRCPVMLYSAMGGTGAGRVARRLVDACIETMHTKFETARLCNVDDSNS